jgi:hypothetical protein
MAGLNVNSLFATTIPRELEEKRIRIGSKTSMIMPLGTDAIEKVKSEIIFMITFYLNVYLLVPYQKQLKNNI